ncbi:DNA primase [Candidatus Woesearchaeota archaeon]|nr:DNA primase [Candidatus Woesearchaeota archaeon]
MGKISPVSAKYIIHTSIGIDGVVDGPDVIGAIFGQTEGLLGNDLELRELQRNGRIGRIEVKHDIRGGKTSGTIIIPSSLDKAETAIIGASLETIQRIGPCNARVKVEKIEDVRVSKRQFVVERAKELLKELTNNVLPDSQEITDEVAYSVRMMEITEYGEDRLPAGPNIDDSDEVILVEGRADVLNLLKHGIKNVVAINGTSVPETVKELGKRKVITVFVDGDRGGDLIIRELMNVLEVDYVVKAPDGKEVEEITKKEIFKALRSKVAVEQVKMEMPKEVVTETIDPKKNTDRRKVQPNVEQNKEYNLFKDMLEDLVGTRGAYIVDKESNILGKVPVNELVSTLKNLNDKAYAIIMDGIVDYDTVKAAERSNSKILVGSDTKFNPNNTRVEILTKKDF